MSTLTSDPINNTLIDELMERGLVRDIAEWTDEEAEWCRLASFFPVTTLVRKARGHFIAWIRPAHGDYLRDMDFSYERLCGHYDSDDSSLTAMLSWYGDWHRRLTLGVPLPDWAEGLEWPALVAKARARLHQQREQAASYAAARAKRRAGRKTHHRSEGMST